MNPELKKFISEYASFSEADLPFIADKFKSRKVKKNSCILKQGQVCKDIVFVQRGCLRLYYVMEDIEISVWFSFQATSAIEMYSFISEKPSNYFIQAIED